MSAAAAPAPRLVVGVDGSPGGRAALAWALAEAARRGAALEVVVAYPVDFYWVDPYLADAGHLSDIRADTEARVRAQLDEVRHDPAVNAQPGTGEVPVDVVVVGGAPAEHLVDRAEGAAVLVVGSRGRGAVRSALLGSVALHCVTHAPCAVVVVHPSAGAGGTAAGADVAAPVVVGLDDSGPARSALAVAAQVADRWEARLEAVVAYRAPAYWGDLYAVTAPPLGETPERATARGEALVRDVLGPDAQLGGAVRVVAVEGRAGDALVEYAATARLLVLGSRSRNRLPGLLLGSVALHCAATARCPVMIVHPAPRRLDAAATGPAAVPATSG